MSAVDHLSLNLPDFLSLAVKIAQSNPEPKWKLASVAVKGGSVLSVGQNMFRQNDTPPNTIHYTDLGIHAEENCLRGLAVVPKILYVARVTKSGRVAMARPCPRCMKQIRAFGIKQICYTTNEGYAVERLT